MLTACSMLNMELLVNPRSSRNAKRTIHKPTKPENKKQMSREILNWPLLIGLSSSGLFENSENVRMLLVVVETSPNRQDPEIITTIIKTVPTFSLRVHSRLQRDQDRQLCFIFRLPELSWSDSAAVLEFSEKLLPLPLLLFLLLNKQHHLPVCESFQWGWTLCLSVFLAGTDCLCHSVSWVQLASHHGAW